MGGGGGPETKSTGALPFWVQGAHRGLVGSAENFAYGDRGAYIPYPNQRIIGLTGAEQSANQARVNLFNRGDVAGNFAGEQLGIAAGYVPGMYDVGFSEFTTDEMNRRMSPYIEGVLNPQLREAEESFNRRLYQSEADSIARGGAVGSYRQGLERALLEGEKARSLGEIRGAGMQYGYDTALNSFLQDRQSRQQALADTVGAYTGLSSAADTLGTNSLNRMNTLIAELERSGAIERELSQREADLAYQDFVEERDWPMRNMQFLSGILTGVPNAQIATQSTMAPQPGILSQMASLGLGTYAVQQAFGNQGG